MDTTCRDAVGQPLTKGDHVAHVDIKGCISRRIVADVRPRTSKTMRDAWEVFLVPLSRYRSPPSRPRNLIRITAP